MQNCFTKKTSWWRVATAFIAGCLIATLFGKASSALVVLIDELSLTLPEAGMIISLFSIMSGLLGLVFGVLSTRYGALVCAVLGLLLCGLGSIGGAYVDSFEFLLISRIIEGTGFILAVVALPALIQQATRREDLPIAMGIWGAFMPLGISLALWFSPVLLNFWGWRGLWIVIGCVIMVWALIIWLLFKPSNAVSRHVPPLLAEVLKVKEIILILFLPQTLWMFLCFAIYSTLFISVVSFLPTLLVEQHSTSLVYANKISALVVAGNIVGNYCAGFMIKKGANSGNLLIIGFTIMGVLGAIMFQSFLGPPGKLICGLGFAIFGGLIPGSLFVISSKLSLGSLSLLVFVGVLLQGAGIGQALGASLTTLIVEKFDMWQATSVFMLGIMSLGIIFALILRTKLSD
jgi:MFS transporter, CP family, cyanate transporter